MVIEDLSQAHKGIMFLKLCAACSPDEQPNDSARSFPILKQFEQMLRNDRVEILEPPWMKRFQKWLEKKDIFDLASRRTVVEFMWNIEVILGKAYAPQIIQSSYRKTGIAPFSALRICEHYPKWSNLSKKEAIAVLNAVEKLSDNVFDSPHGYLTEDLLSSHLEPIFGPPSKYIYLNIDDAEGGENSDDQERPFKRRCVRKPLDLRPVNHRRAICLNSENFIRAQLEERRLKRIDSEMAAEKMRLKKTTEGRMTVAQLKENLRASNLSSRGTKDELIRRLMEHNMQAQREEELVLLP